MSKDEPQTDELERYRIRFSLYKVIAGTMIVGLAGVLIPGAVQFWEIEFERTRQQEEYVKNFLGTALDQDIELRIRFTDYFANVAPSNSKPDWMAYRDSLVKARNIAREEIRLREEKIRKVLSKDSHELAMQIEIAQLERELDWLYAETGYIAKNRSIVRGPTETKENVSLKPLPLDVPSHVPSTNADYDVVFLKGNYSARQKQANDECIAYVEHHFNSSASPSTSYTVTIVASNADEVSKTWDVGIRPRSHGVFRFPFILSVTAGFWLAGSKGDAAMET